MAELARRLRWPRLLLVIVFFLPSVLAGVHGASALDGGRGKEADLMHAAVARLSVAAREGGGGGHPGGGHAGGGHVHGGGGGGGGGHGRPELASYHNNHLRRSSAPGRELAGHAVAANCALLLAGAFALLLF
ncbi:hypothetical protein GUJ93_ZPchr0013g38024 [Zizania palustris]|uniref:Uncharacterized protein n=1 Tax=Zizania palustris TaxID=103762 RepID=A0A8J5X4N7_ZIZPA|nr:hypothetical protein GUJ93_ZPchr0013g38024 [Zizania palustris]KAG8100175.1 hypothetical protein GUJ93_ZPchr0013g38024 [Zizania palustris]